MQFNSFLTETPEQIHVKKNGSDDWLPGGGTPLHEAAEGGHSEVIKCLLRHGPEVDAPSIYGRTSLFLAAYRGHTQALELLLGAGASLTATDSNGWQPLHVAIRCGHKTCVEALLRKKADIEAKTSNNFTPLLYAALAGHVEIIKCLLKHGADSKYEHGSGNALISAILNNKEDAVHYLFHHPEMELTSCCNGLPGKVPIICYAAKVGNYTAVVFSIKKGASLHDQLSDGRTILHCAVEAVNHHGVEKYGIVRLLLRAGADMLHRDTHGNTPLSTLPLSPEQSPLAQAYFENRSLYLSGHISETDTIDSVVEIAAYFLDIPVLEALKDRLESRLAQHRSNGDNLLMTALKYTDLEGIHWLLDQKICAIDDVDEENHDALWLAINNRFDSNTRKLAVINKLLEAGAKVTEDHLLQAANCPYKGINEILMRLVTIYRYSQRPQEERLSLFK